MLGLRWQLAVFYLALSVPALLLIEQAVLAVGFYRCLRELDDGRLQRVIDTEARSLAAVRKRGIHPEDLQERLKRFVLQLERPRESLGTEAAYVLLELAEHPFRVDIVASDAAPPPPVPHTVHRLWQSSLSANEVLRLQLLVPSPWRHFQRGPSFEWPIAVAYLIIFLIGSAAFLRWRVLDRMARMERTASAWATGDFGQALSDPSADELGALARALNRMAHDLKSQFATRAQLATLEERRRLARDLHDTVKQKVFALSMQLEAARASALRSAGPRDDALSESLLLVGEIQRELNDLLRELRADTGERDDLVPALRQRGEDFSRRSGVALDLRLPDECPLPPRTVDGILRIVDEALANAWRHSGSATATLRLDLEPGMLALEIADQGVGGATRQPPGSGLGNLRQRAADLGGSLDIRSPEGEGTTIRLLIPERA